MGNSNTKIGQNTEMQPLFRSDTPIETKDTLKPRY